MATSENSIVEEFGAYRRRVLARLYDPIKADFLLALSPTASAGRKKRWWEDILTIVTTGQGDLVAEQKRLSKTKLTKARCLVRKFSRSLAETVELLTILRKGKEIF